METFYAAKLHRGKRLVVRVPFVAEVNSAITVLLELPTGFVVAIDGTVILAEAETDGRGTTIELSLHGITAEIIDRLKQLVADAALDSASAQSDDDGLEIEVQGAEAGPLDAPIDEFVPAPLSLERADVPEAERPRFDAMAMVLGDLRQSAAHDVLGVSAEASIDEIRTAYLERTKRLHPDILASSPSPHVRAMAQEIFILVNKAYDRLRDAAVADGTAMICGPALLPHAGWMAGIDDFLEPRGASVLSERPPTDPSAAEGDGVARLRHRALSEGGLFGDLDLGADDGSGSLDDQLVRSTRSRKVEATARDYLEREDFESAKEVLASGLHNDPRDRQLRALYHVVSGLAAADAGQMVMATSQFEAALAHDRDCQEAASALDLLRTSSGTRGGLFRRILK